MTVYVVWYMQPWAECFAAGVKAVFSRREDAEAFARTDSDFEVEECVIDFELESAQEVARFQHRVNQLESQVREYRHMIDKIHSK